MKGLLLSFAFLFSVSCFSQGILTVDKTEVRIGDQVKVTIKTDLSEGREWINTDKLWPDSLKGIEVVNGPVWNKENLKAVLATWTISLFDTGWVRIPPLPISVVQNGHSDTIFTNDVPIKVLAVEPDSSGLRAIKDIYVQPFNPGYYKRYLPHLAVLILLITGILYWLRQRKKNRAVPVYIPPPPLPHDWAYNALYDLAEKKLWQKGEVKEHYSLLTAILREYLERRYGIHAMEQTSDEILTQLRNQNLSPALLQDTGELLSAADLIKFAKADPGTDLHAATIDRVRAFVRETTPSVQPEFMESPKDAADEVVE